jgi:hypothetical protein
MVDILTGGVEDRERTPQERGVDPAASAMGKKGGAARAKSMTPERLSRHTNGPTLGGFIASTLRELLPTTTEPLRCVINTQLTAMSLIVPTA